MNCWFSSLDGLHTNCNELFQPIVVDTGICYSFNMVHWKRIFKPHVKHMWQKMNINTPHILDWDPNKNQYINSTSPHHYPRRGFMSGIRKGLSITLLSQRKTNDMLCNEYQTGFRVNYTNFF